MKHGEVPRAMEGFVAGRVIASKRPDWVRIANHVRLTGALYPLP